MVAFFSPTQGEVALADQIFARHDPQGFRVITKDAAFDIFGVTLVQIWSIAQPDNQDFLTRKDIYVALRLFGWAQKGEAISAELVNKPGPLAVINGFSSSAESRRAVPPSSASPDTSGLPCSLSAQDKTTFAQYFNRCNPVNGILSGEKAREVFATSKLPFEKLAQIWTLSDTQNRGSLDVADFIVGMYLVNASMTGQLPFIPTTLPPGLYEMASDQSLLGSTVASTAIGNRGSLNQGKQFQPTSVPFSAFVAPWDVTPTEKAWADMHFNAMDKLKRGYIEPDVASSFFLQSKVPELDLALIWDLADLNIDGRLTRDGFAVALHLIEGRLCGKEIPTHLPESLVPPSMRAVTTSPFQLPPSDPLNDSLWDDPPVTPQPQSRILQPQRRWHKQGQSTFGLSSSRDAHAAHGTLSFQKDIPGELEHLARMQITRDITPDPNDPPWLLPGMNDKPRRVSEKDDENESPTEHHATSIASSEKEVARLDHERITDLERQLSESLAVQTERDRRIAQLTNQLAQKSALLEEAEANAVEAKNHASLELRELKAKLDELTLSCDEHLRTLEQAQSALQKATSRNDERDQPACGHEGEIAEMRAELGTVRLRLTDAENRCTKSKAEADALRAGTQAAGGLVNMDVDRVMRKLMERVRTVEAEMSSLRGDEKSIESMKCTNEG